MTLNLPSIPNALAVLVTLAELQEKVGAVEEALGLAVFARDHPACRKVTAKRAQDLFSELTARLSSQTVATIRERMLSQRLNQVAQEMLPRAV